jgi:hypothetical protein
MLCVSSSWNRPKSGNASVIFDGQLSASAERWKDGPKVFENREKKAR